MASDPSLDRPAAPDPPSSSSSKRRWSPCTWRYAIEESQPELGSKPRTAGGGVSSSSSAPSAVAARATEAPKKPPGSPETAGEVLQNGVTDAIVMKAPVGSPPIAQSPSPQEEEGSPKDAEASKRRRKKKEGVRTNGEAEQAEGFMSTRGEREMTPSELYFCEICAAKATASSRKTTGSPVPIDHC